MEWLRVAEPSVAPVGPARSDWKGYSPDFDGVGEYQGVTAVTNEPRDGFDFSGAVPLAPYGFLILSQEEETAKEPGEPASAA